MLGGAGRQRVHRVRVVARGFPIRLPDISNGGDVMRLHTLQNCIALAEAIPVERDNFRVLGELLIELRHLAKAEEATK